MKRLLCSSLLLLACCTIGIAQTAKIPDAALTAKTQAYAGEVYKDYTMYLTPQHMKTYEEWLGRTEIKTEAYSPSESYPLLSSIGLKNKYNPALQRDNAQTFNPSTFNPFKYFLEFETKTDKVYRVDNTQYIIVVHGRQAGK